VALQVMFKNAGPGLVVLLGALYRSALIEPLPMLSPLGMAVIVAAVLLFDAPIPCAKVVGPLRVVDLVVDRGKLPA